MASCPRNTVAKADLARRSGGAWLYLMIKMRNLALIVLKSTVSYSRQMLAKCSKSPKHRTHPISSGATAHLLSCAFHFFVLMVINKLRNMMQDVQTRLRQHGNYGVRHPDPHGLKLPNIIRSTTFKPLGPCRCAFFSAPFFSKQSLHNGCSNMDLKYAAESQMKHTVSHHRWRE